MAHTREAAASTEYISYVDGALGGAHGRLYTRRKTRDKTNDTGNGERLLT